MTSIQGIMYMKAAATLQKMFGGFRVPSTTSSVSGSRIFALSLLCIAQDQLKHADNIVDETVANKFIPGCAAVLKLELLVRHLQENKVP